VENLTIELLATFGGCTAAVTTLTQILKRYVKVVDPKVISLVLALVIQITLVALQGATWDMYALAAFNGVLVSGSSIGLYEGVVSLGQSKDDSKQNMEGEK